MLSHYVSVGVEELDQDRPLLRLQYHNSIADAVADLGRPEEIGQVFARRTSKKTMKRLVVPVEQLSSHGQETRVSPIR